MNVLIYTVAPALFHIGIPVLYLIAIVFGIMSLTGKKKDIKVLCVWGLLTAITSLLVTFQGAVNYLINIEVLNPRDVYPAFNTIINVNNLINVFLGIVSWILLWLYVKRAYRINVVPLIVSLVAFILVPIVKGVLLKAFYLPDDHNLWYSRRLLISCIAILIILAVQVMYLVIFMKNRSKEENVPSIWLFQHIVVVTTIISILLILGGIIFTSDGYGAFEQFISFLIAAILPVRNYYFFRRSR